MTTIEFMDQGHVTTPAGWRAGVAACGIKYTNRDDLALLISDAPCTAAALFTTNRVQSAHISYDRIALNHNKTNVRAVLINAGSANACTGRQGITIARLSAEIVEQTLGLKPYTTLVMSTGVIGTPLPIDKVRNGIQQASSVLDAEHGPAAARAIMTTDTRPKYCAIRVTMPDGQSFHIGGMVKGSGMIHPNMATMLCVITTDIRICDEWLHHTLRVVTRTSFHCISVDGDTSTNDTILALANGQSSVSITDIESPLWTAFYKGMEQICQWLAQEVVRDGEGATRFITINVRRAMNDRDAHTMAMAIARSPLVKTAFFAADPNWGRVVCALGNSGALIDTDNLVLSFNGVKVFEHGVPVDFDEQEVHALLDAPEIQVDVNLGGLGLCSATVWTSDFSYDYVKINAEYRT